MATIPFAKVSLDELEANAASETILSGWVTQGPQVIAFEQEFTQLVGAAHACAVSNCTAALHLALKAVLCVHQLGMPCNLDPIIAVSRKHGLTIRPHSALGYRPPAPETIIPIDPRPAMR